MSSEKEAIPKRILCVGLCFLDFIHICPQTVQEGIKQHFPKGHCQRGGNSSNVSTIISLLGGKVEFLGLLTKVEGFELLVDDLIAKNICIDHCPRTDLDPGFSSIFLDQSTQTRTIITHLNKDFGFPSFEDFKKLNLDNYLWAHFEGKFKPVTSKMIQHVYDYNKNKSDNKIKISVEFDFVGFDNNYVGPDLLALTDLADVVFMSKSFSQAHGWTNMKEAAFNLKESITNTEILIICFWNEQGAGMLFNNVFDVVEPYKFDNTKDPVGYTDSFIGGTLYSLSLGTEPRDAVDFGNKVAAFKLNDYGFNHVANLPQ